MKSSGMHAVVFVLVCSVIALTGMGVFMGSMPTFAEPVVADPSQPNHATNKPRFEDAPADAPLEAYRTRLLNVSMDAVSKMPLHPHIKNRSRAQEAVALAALELDQPRLALGYMSRIDNWRKGVVSAEYMLYAARRGHYENMDRYELIARASAKLATQDWRREHVHVRIVQAKMMLGNPGAAVVFNSQLENPSYVGQTELVEAEQMDRSDDAAYKRLVARLDALIKLTHYEVIINSGQVYTELYRKHYQDLSRRDEIEKKLRLAYKNMPGPETIDLLIGLAEAAVSHKDLKHARSLLSEAKELTKRAGWNKNREYQYEYAGKLAEAFYRSGDRDSARAIIDESLAYFNENESEVYNLWRPDCLRPLAGASQLIGDTKTARSLYARALKAGALNPNGRPQAEDLAATCTSMALYAFEPDKALWDEIQRLQDQLSDPW